MMITIRMCVCVVHLVIVNFEKFSRYERCLTSAKQVLTKTEFSHWNVYDCHFYDLTLPLVKPDNVGFTILLFSKEAR